MINEQQRFYPTVLGAAHLIILYLFVQTVVDFPLALWDYYHGTDYLSNTFKNIALQLGSTLFILYYAYRNAGARLNRLFPARRFNLLLMVPVTTFLMGAHVFLEEINMAVERLIPAPSWFLELFSRLFENDFGIYGTFLKVVILAPVIEELIFRGIIMYGFMRNYRAHTAILVSALFFALFHLNPWQFPATFLLGLLLGTVMVITRNIFACIAGHAINNFLVLITIGYWEPIHQFSFFLLERKQQLLISYLVSGLSVVLIGFFAIRRRSQ